MSEIKAADIESPDRAIIPQVLAIKAMRDSGYKNTDCALAELIDNSVQANASHVEVICIEEYQQIKKSLLRRIREIGILDNGEGMEPETLRRALQFGNGTHLTDRKGMGRFGMGLPNSSISQCRRVEVWTWQSGPDNAMYTYIDLDEIECREMRVVPVPVHESLPDEWRTRSKIIGTSGTLVLWSKLEYNRLSWRSAKTTLKNTELLIGRMYRKFIVKEGLSIRLLSWLEGEAEPDSDELVRVNDPLYLMHNSSTPFPFDKDPMFQRWSEEDEVFPIDYEGAPHEVIVRVSYARQKTVDETEGKCDRGHKPYGKYAAKNRGLSIIREGRELKLDKSWTNGEPTERWWGVEVEFPSTLDEVFGVTNNKQDATNLSRMAGFEWEDEADPGELRSEFCARIESEGDLCGLLIPIAEHIHKQIKQARILLKAQTKGHREKSERHDGPTAADLATTKNRERAEQGHETAADSAEFTEEDRENFAQELKDDYPDEVAERKANEVVKHNLKVDISHRELDGHAFFAVKNEHGRLTEIIFNTKHLFHKQLFESLDLESLNKDTGDESNAELIDRIHKAVYTLKLLFAAWARYEEEAQQKEKEQLHDMRQQWGKMARFFLKKEDE